MSPGTILCDHINDFNKLILDLANTNIEIEDEDQSLMLLMLFPSVYEKFVETLLYGRESSTTEDLLVILNLGELKKITECTKEETGDWLYVRGGSDRSGKVHYVGSSWFKSRDRTGGSYHMIHRRDFLYDFMGFDGGSVQWVITEHALSKGQGKGHAMKMQIGTIKVIKGCQVMMTGIKKKNCVYTLEAK
ncbi:hypothetical protein Tco_1037599 [Tanacetum coccineum]